jgi:hypothetical protein
MLHVLPCASVPRPQRLRTYYQVLGIAPGEQDPRVIEEAALGCSCHSRAYQLCRESECARRLNEIAQALSTLLDPDRRREYDRGLKKPSGPAMSYRRPRRRRDTPVLPRGMGAPPTAGKGPLVLLLGDGGVCDVKLVHRRSALREAGHGRG